MKKVFHCVEKQSSHPLPLWFVSRCGNGQLCDSPEAWQALPSPDHRLLLPLGGRPLHDGELVKHLNICDRLLKAVAKVQTDGFISLQFKVVF